MALVKCDECEKPISSNATSCPHCGKILVVSRWKRNVLVGIVGAVAVWALIGVYVGNKSSQEVMTGVASKLESRKINGAGIFISSYETQGNDEYTCGSAHYKDESGEEKVILFYAVQRRPMMTEMKIVMGDEAGFFKTYEKICMKAS